MKEIIILCVIWKKKKENTYVNTISYLRMASKSSVQCKIIKQVNILLKTHVSKIFLNVVRYGLMNVVPSGKLLAMHTTIKCY